MDVVEQVNALLPLARLERMLHMYRTWVNVEGVEGGLALSRHELECVLEFPTQPQSVDFLVDTFRCKPQAQADAGQVRVDLVTLLATAAVLAQGALADKARFVFQLVDLDTEDDIVEAELALVVSACCNGLGRLNLMPEDSAEEVTEMDALAIAYEAFEFLELEEGDKMTFAMFLKWCVFHPRPAGLFEHIGCLFSMCDAVRKMKQALQDRRARESADPFHYYSDMHFGSLDEQAERVGVVVGPIVGKITATKANVLVEVDTLTTVKCFAFVYSSHDMTLEKDLPVLTKELILQPFQPTLFTLSGLAPGTTYVLRFLGVRKDDREKCVAVITTTQTSPESDIVESSASVPSAWRVRVLNHRQHGGFTSGTAKSPESHIYHKVALQGYQSRTPLLSIHFGSISLSQQKVNAMLQMLEEAHEETCDLAAERVIEIIKQAYRSALTKPNIWVLLRSHTNWFFDNNDSVLFSGFSSWTTTQPASYTKAQEQLTRLSLPVWQSYIGCLWGPKHTPAKCIKLDTRTIFAPVVTDFDLQSEDGVLEFTTRVAKILNAFPKTVAILFATTTPIVPTVCAADCSYFQSQSFPPAKVKHLNTPGRPGTADNSRQWRLLQDLVGWSLADLNRQVVLLSFSDSESFQTVVNIKNTTLSLTQLVCGPLVGVPGVDAHFQENFKSETNSTEQMIVVHGVRDYRPQYIEALTVKHSLDEPAAVGKRHSSGVAESRFLSRLVPLQGLREIRQILGPIVGCVSPHCAQVLIECDTEGEIACVIIDRLSAEECCIIQRVKAFRPTIFTINELTPGRTYDLSYRGLSNGRTGVVQTPLEHLPAFRLVVVSDDRFLDGTMGHYASNNGKVAEPLPSYIPNVVNHLMPLARALQSDVTIHLGCVVALAHDIGRKYSLHTQEQRIIGRRTLQNSVRECIRQHWNTPANQQLLSRGAHWFPRIGALRALLKNEDIPVAFLKEVSQVLSEYERVGDFRAARAIPNDKYIYHLQRDVAVLMIDSLEVLMENTELAPFANLQETLLTTSQWKALKFWLRIDPTQSDSDAVSHPDTLIIMCDLPLISQRGEAEELKQMWDRTVQLKGGASKLNGSTCLAEDGETSWSLYPKERTRLLRLIFLKLKKHPRFHVVFICSGAFASRTTIIDKETQLSFQQIVVGPVSKSASPIWVEKVAANIALQSSHGAEDAASRYLIEHELPTGATTSQQYCVLEVAPHPLGPSSDVKFYLQHHGDARLILGPILGRITPRTARILIEVDRPVSSLVCTLTDPATSQSFAAEVKVEAFTPTIIKIEGLQPGTRYAINFIGLLESKDAVLGYVWTPAWVALTSEWLIVNRNSVADFAQTQSSDSSKAVAHPSSQWPRILTRGIPAFTAQLAGDTSYRNGDSLGDHKDEGHLNFNPWHSIEDEYLSEPLVSPQLLLHLGGQVDMSRAFTDDELASLVVRLASHMEANQHDEDNPVFQHLRSELRHRMQDVYRVAWGVPPMKRLLGYASNLMLLNEDSDLYYSLSTVRDVMSRKHHSDLSDTTLASVVAILRGLAFELWQLYQNQLWVDLAERELKYGTKSSGNKAAFSVTYGICRMIVANVTHEVYEYCATVDTTKTVLQASDKAKDVPTVTIFSPPSWKVIDEALDSSASAAPDTGLARTVSTRPKNSVQQLVLVISGDLMAWGGSSKQFPALRAEIVKLLEKLFAWKFLDRVRREVSVICCRTNGSSITFEVTDEKLSEKLTLTCIGSVSEPRDLLHRDEKKVKGAAATSVPISKGHFSKRFSYRSITTTSSGAAGPVSSGSSMTVAQEQQSSASSDVGSRGITRCRTFVSYRFITDFRRGFFDETLRFFPSRISLPKAVLGPVIGRMVLDEAPRASQVEGSEPLAEGDPGDPVEMHFSVPILLEINADARVVCVVTDVLANRDVRVTETLTRYEPHVFQITSLVPERRYVYRFEGIANSDQRHGSFHTPPSSPTSFNFVAVSSNFPEQMEESTDSLWAAIKTRVQTSWCGLDSILHLGGQVPMHEAAFECFEWVRRELKRTEKCKEPPQPDKPTNNQETSSNELAMAPTESSGDVNPFEELLRRKVRQRLQQRYRICWNIPNVREALAHTSNWFLRSQADVAPFFRNQEVLYTKAARLILSEAKQVVADYQLALMQREASELHDPVGNLEENPSGTAGTSGSKKTENVVPEQPEVGEKSYANESVVPTDTNQSTVDKTENSILNQNELEPETSSANIENERTDTAQFVQVGEVGIFFCDMRSTPPDDIVTCNNRLATPLTRQERAIIGEKQWLQLEKALKKKTVLAFVLCMELPLILTNAKHVDATREAAAFSGFEPGQEEISGRWKLYDRQTIFQHWISCRRQLEQLLTLLFRWKAKRRGRDIVVLSGGMRVGLDTLLQDRETKLYVRSLTVGPLTARIESCFDDMPLDGTACPTFASQRDEQFTFSHSLVIRKNYLLAHIGITREQETQSGESGATEVKVATFEMEFVADDGKVDIVHPVDQYRRFPAWWSAFVPMGKVVFWDDTVMMRAQSDEDVVALVRYLQDSREFTAALEVLFEKHQFAEAARMEELRSKHRRRRRGPEELRGSLRAVFAELWKVLPDIHRQQVAYFKDEFVFDFLLGYIAPKLFEDDEYQDDDVERPPLEFAAFSSLCRDFVFNACVLHLSLCMQQEDERRKIALHRAEAQRQAAQRAAQRAQQDQQLAEEAAELQQLKQDDPEAYSKRMLVEQENVLQEKRVKAEAAREQRKAEKMRDVEEELAIAKEQRKLDKLAERGEQHEYERRREVLAVRVRKLEERKRHREAEEARRRKQKEIKRKSSPRSRRRARPGLQRSPLVQRQPALNTTQ